MKKLILFALMFMPVMCFSQTTYFSLQWDSVVVDTNTLENDQYLRGGFHVGFDTQTLLANGIDTQFDVWTSSVVISTNTFITIKDITMFQVSIGSVTISTSTFITGGILHVGNGGTVNFADGDGDGYFKDELEVDGTSVFAGITTIGASGISVSGGLIATVNDIDMNADDREFTMGAGGQFSLGFAGSDDQFRIVRGNDNSTDANVAFIITPSTWAAIGSTVAATAMDGQGDFFTADELQAGSTIYADSAIQFVVDINTTVAPSSTNIIGIANDISGIPTLYISTAAVDANSWIKVGAQ